MFTKSLGFEVKYELFQEHAAYVRNALVWASQGIYSKFEYLERIFFDVILGDDSRACDNVGIKSGKYDVIDDYMIKDYKERPHMYKDQ